MKILLGISGWAGAGKDSFADALVANHSFVKISFADPLRAIAAAINPIVAFETKNFYHNGDPETGELLGYEVEEIRYNDALERLGYNAAKFEYEEFRRLLQVIGTDAGRKIIKDSLWLDLAMERVAQHERVVIADVRFENEAQAIVDNGGWTLRITRPGVEAANQHISEHDLDSWYFTDEIPNYGTLEDLAHRADNVMADILGTA